MIRSAKALWNRELLDLDHPLTPHVFAAARAIDDILMAGHKMTISARHERRRLRDQCIAHTLPELRQLSRDHFAARPEIPPAIDDLEQALNKLSELPGVPDEGSPPVDFCPVCGHNVKHRRRGCLPFLLSLMFPVPPLPIYCSACFAILMPTILLLQSSESGFGTDDI